jgi:hypothetical protein
LNRPVLTSPPALGLGWFGAGRASQLTCLAVSFVMATTACSTKTDRAASASATASATASSLSTASDDSSADLPAPAVPLDQIEAWLETTGVVFDEVRRIGGELTSGAAATVQQCRAWVAQLGAGPVPSDLVDVASTAPDPVLGDALAQTVLSLNRALSRCTSEQLVDAELLAAIVGGLSVIDDREAGL